jgi:hypothetical protein
VTSSKNGQLDHQSLRIEFFDCNNKGVLTLFGVGSKGFHRYENQPLDQTIGYAFVLSLLHHLQTHLFAMYKALLCCPRIQGQSHHDSLPNVPRPLK